MSIALKNKGLVVFFCLNKTYFGLKKADICAFYTS